MKSIIRPIINNTRLTCVLVFLSIGILPFIKRIESGRKKLCCSTINLKGNLVWSEISDNQGIECFSRVGGRADVPNKDAFFRIPEIFTECDIQGNGKCLKPCVELMNVELWISQQENDLPAFYLFNRILHALFMSLAMCYNN